MTNKSEIVAIVIIGVGLFLLVRRTSLEPWHVLVVLLAAFVLEFYVPQINVLVSKVIAGISSAIAKTHH